MEWHAFGTHLGPYHGVPATGRQIEVDGCHAFTMSPEGRILSDKGYWDVASLLRQIGVTPAWSAEGAVAQ